MPVAQAVPVPGCGQRKRCQHTGLCSSLIWYCLFFIYVLLIYWPASLPATCPESMHRYCLPNPHSFCKFHCSLTCAVLPWTLVTIFSIAQPRREHIVVLCSSFLETSEALLWFHFFGNKSRLSAWKCFQWLYIVHNVVFADFLEISISQYFLACNGERKRIRTFVTQGFPTFSIKRIILQNALNISNTRPWPIKIHLWPSGRRWPTGWDTLVEMFSNQSTSFEEYLPHTHKQNINIVWKMIYVQCTFP